MAKQTVYVVLSVDKRGINGGGHITNAVGVYSSWARAVGAAQRAGWEDDKDQYFHVGVMDVNAQAEQNSAL